MLGWLYGFGSPSLYAVGIDNEDSKSEHYFSISKLLNGSTALSFYRDEYYNLYALSTYGGNMSIRRSFNIFGGGILSIDYVGTTPPSENLIEIPVT